VEWLQEKREPRLAKLEGFGIRYQGGTDSPRTKGNRKRHRLSGDGIYSCLVLLFPARRVVAERRRFPKIKWIVTISVGGIGNATKYGPK
jgi:hypothetical protein